MGFVNLKLADVELKRDQVPAGTYTFQLAVGAAVRHNDYKNWDELNVRFVVVDGEYAGKSIFAGYPDPESVNPKSGKPNTWSAQALKKLEIALGIESTEGEDAVDYLNRAAATGNARVTANVTEYVVEGKEPKSQFQVFSVGPAA